MTKKNKLPFSKSPCTGCGLCASVCPHECIRMVESDEGFYIPHVDDTKCKKCGACQNACSKRDSADKNRIPNFELQCYEVYVNNSIDRLESSSGGFCTELSRQVIKEGGFVYGVAMSDTFRAKYIEVSDEENLVRLRGSKYIQADTTDVFNLVAYRLKEKRTVLFIGTSCVIKALRVRFGFSNPLLIVVDIACYGVPSYNLLDAYIRELNVGKDKLRKIYFKNKHRGWRNNSLKLVFESGNELIVPAGESPFIQGFDTRLCLNLPCYLCLRSPIHRVSDITCADYWGHEDKTSDNSYMGISCIVCHSSKGEEALNRIRDKVTCNPVSLKSVQKNNYGLVDVSERIPNERSHVLHLLKTRNASSVIRRFVYAEGGKIVSFKLFRWRIMLPEKLYVILRSIVRRFRK